MHELPSPARTVALATPSRHREIFVPPRGEWKGWNGGWTGNTSLTKVRECWPTRSRRSGGSTAWSPSASGRWMITSSGAIARWGNHACCTRSGPRAPTSATCGGGWVSMPATSRRLVQTLEEKGLIRLSPGTADQRVRRARWTAAGRREVREMNRRADQAAADLLDSLSSAQRTRLVAAMAEVHRLLQLAGLQIERVDPASPAARWCVGQYFDELNRRFESGFDPGASLPADDRDLVPPRGAFLVASVDGEPVASGAVKPVVSRCRVAQANVGCRDGPWTGHWSADAGGAGDPGARARHDVTPARDQSDAAGGHSVCTEAPGFGKWPASAPIPMPTTGSRSAWADHILQLIALAARQRGAEPSRPPFGRQDPGVHLPRRRVADVLGVSAFELGDPVLLRVLSKADDALLAHGDLPVGR